MVYGNETKNVFMGLRITLLPNYYMSFSKCSLDLGATYRIGSGYLYIVHLLPLASGLVVLPLFHLLLFNHYAVSLRCLRRLVKLIASAGVSGRIVFVR